MESFSRMVFDLTGTLKEVAIAWRLAMPLLEPHE